MGGGAGCSRMLDQHSAYHGLPSDTVVVSGVFIGEVIFEMMKEGFTSVFDDHMLYLMYNQQISSTVEGINTDLNLAIRMLYACTFLLISMHVNVTDVAGKSFELLARRKVHGWLISSCKPSMKNKMPHSSKGQKITVFS